MNCESHGVLIKNFVHRFEYLNSYFLSISNSYIKNNHGMSGLWCVAREQSFYLFYKESTLCTGNRIIWFVLFS